MAKDIDLARRIRGDDLYGSLLDWGTDYKTIFSLHPDMKEALAFEHALKNAYKENERYDLRKGRVKGIDIAEEEELN